MASTVLPKSGGAELVGVIVYADEHYRYTGGAMAYACRTDVCSVGAAGGNVSDSNATKTATLTVLKAGKYRIRKSGQTTTAVTIVFPGFSDTATNMEDVYEVSLSANATVSAAFKPVYNGGATSAVYTGTITVEKI